MKRMRGYSNLGGRGMAVDEAARDARLRALAERLLPDGRTRLRLGEDCARALRRSLRDVSAMDSAGDDALNRLRSDAGRVEACLQQARAESGAKTLASEDEPRVLLLARELIDGGERLLTKELLLRELALFDAARSLEMRELQLIPAALRIALCEALADVVRDVICVAKSRAAADEWVRAGGKGRMRGDCDEAFFERALQLSLELEQPVLHARVERAIERCGQRKDWLVERAHRIAADCCLRLENLMQLKHLLDGLNWRRCFEALSPVEQELRDDPAGLYPRMDADSRARVRQQVEALARRAKAEEIVVVRHALRLARAAMEEQDSENASADSEEARAAGLASDDPRASVFWYLVEDEGRSALCREMGARAPRRMLIDPSGRRSVALVCALTAAALAVILWGIGEPWLMVFGLPLAWGCAWRVLGRFYPKFVRPGKLLKLRLESVPEDARTLVALPVLLSGEARAREMVARMEAMGCLERDPNVDFLLLGDFRDGDAPHEPEDEAILRAARAGVARLNAAAGREKYHYLHRARKLREIDNRWMGENRKRGALMALNRLLLGREGVAAAFEAEGACAPQLAGRYRYVITLDADTEYLPGTVQKLVGTMLHPFNRCPMVGEEGRNCAATGEGDACLNCTAPEADGENQVGSNRKFDGEGAKEDMPEGTALHSLNRCREAGEDGRSCAAPGVDGQDQRDFNKIVASESANGEKPEDMAYHPSNHCREEGEDSRSCAALDADGACQCSAESNADGACQGYSALNSGDGRALNDIHGQWNRRVENDAPEGETLATGKPAGAEAAAEAIFGEQSESAEAAAGKAAAGQIIGEKSVNEEADAGKVAAGESAGGKPENEKAAGNSTRQNGRKSRSRNRLGDCSGDHSCNCPNDCSPDYSCKHSRNSFENHSRNCSRARSHKNARNRSRDSSHSSPLRRGYAVLQPDMALTAEASLSAYVELTAGRGGVDGYPTSVSDFYQDMTGRGCFAGKGIYDVRAFAEATEGALDDDGILSHDMIEGILAGAGVVDDVRFYDGCPERLGAELQRLHRWTRGDWQLLPVLCSKLRLDAVDRMKIVGNLLRSLYAPALLGLVMLAIWLDMPGAFALGLVLAFLEPALNLPFSLFGEGRRSWRAALLRLATLPATAFCQMDAIFRTLWRLAVSRRHLMDWVTAADASGSDARAKLPGKIAALLALPGMLRGQWIVPALGIAMLFWVGAGWADDLSRQRAGARAPLKSSQTALLTELARRTWHFFETYVPQDGPGLPPDNVQLDPDLGPAMRTSPTNVGLYLMSCLAARELSLLSDRDMRARMATTVNTLEGLEKWNGQLYNWYDIESLAPLRPRYVSAVDSGNLAGALLLCAHALREGDPALSKRLRALAEDMDLAALFDDERELFRIGMDVEGGRLSESHYDLYASEARILSFVAMMLGQAPVKHWARLNRASVRVGNKSALLSWSGTMFEYLMPELLLRSPANSLAGRSREGVAAWQIRHGKRNRRPWGVSESGYYAFDGQLNYQYHAFGLPELALSGDAEAGVIAPYAAALALCCDPAAAAENLRKMCALGWSDEFGLYEAADYVRADKGEGRDDGERMPAATLTRSASADCARLDNGGRSNNGKRSNDDERTKPATQTHSASADCAHLDNVKRTQAATLTRPVTADHAHLDNGERMNDGERTPAATLTRTASADYAHSDNGGRSNDGERTHPATLTRSMSADCARLDNGKRRQVATQARPGTCDYARSDSGKQTLGAIQACSASTDYAHSDNGERPQAAATLSRPIFADHARSDSVEPCIVRSHMAHHQGMALCAICNALRGDVLAKMFMDIPEAHALRLLLQEKPGPLPPRRGHSKPEPRAEHRPEASYSRGGRRNVAVDTHLLHGANTTALITARGATFVWSDGLQLTRFSGNLTNPHEGLFVHLEDAASGACTVLGRSGAAVIGRDDARAASPKGSRASSDVDKAHLQGGTDGTQGTASEARAAFERGSACEAFGKSGGASSDAGSARDREESEETQDAASGTRAAFGKGNARKAFGKNGGASYDANQARDREESEEMQDAASGIRAAFGKGNAPKALGKNDGASYDANPARDREESNGMQGAETGARATLGKDDARVAFNKSARAVFDAGLACFREEFEGIEAELRLCVSPEDGALYQIVELENPGDEARELIVSGCMAVALAPERDMRAHPTFQNLFVEGEELTPRALLLRRRPRTPGQALPGLIYLVSGGESPRSELRLEDLLTRTGSLGEPCGLRWEREGGKARRDGSSQDEPSGPSQERSSEATREKAAMEDAAHDADRRNETDEMHPSAATDRSDSQDQLNKPSRERSSENEQGSEQTGGGSLGQRRDAGRASQSAGRALLNPCAALRVRVRIAPKSRARLHFALLLIPAEEAEQVMREGIVALKPELVRGKAPREERATQTTLESPHKATAHCTVSAKQIERTEAGQPEDATMGLPFAEEGQRGEQTVRAVQTIGHEVAGLRNAADESASAEKERLDEQAACEELTGCGWPSPLRGRAARAMEEDAAERALRLASAQARTVLMHAGVDGARFALYQRSAALLFDPKLRPGVNGGMEAGEPIDRRMLWSAGASGELPILLVELHGDDLSCVREGARLHAFYRSMGVASDFVLVDCRDGGYRRNAGGELGGLIAASHLGGMLDIPGGAHIRERDGLDDSALDALRRAAALRLRSEGAPLTQLRSALDALKLRDGEPYRPMLAVKLPPPSDLQYFNGFGGFRMGKPPDGEPERRAREADDMRVEFARDLGASSGSNGEVGADEQAAQDGLGNSK